MFREATLRTKRDELASCIASRKRKLSELYFATGSISDTEPSPQQNNSRAGKSYNNDHSAFLQANDITKCHYFDEATLPPWQHQRTASQQPDKSIANAAELLGQSGGPQSGDDGGTLVGAPRFSIGTRVLDGNPPIIDNGDSGPNHRSIQGTSTNAIMDLSSAQSSKASQTEPRDVVTTSLDAIIDATIDNVRRAPEAANSTPVSQSELDTPRIKTTLTPPGSPGVDPSKAILVSSEDIRSFAEPSAKLSDAEFGSSHASTVHLPPREVQERSLIEVDQSQETAMRRDRREDEKHPPSAGLPVLTDPVSSPSSTIGPYSTATPGFNGASPDTSPGDEILPDADPDPAKRLQLSHKVDNPDGSAAAQHDSLLRSQMEIARLNALGTDPSTPDAQLRLEAAQSRYALDAATDGRAHSALDSPAGSLSVREPAELTKHAQEVVQDTMDDEDDEVVGVPTPEDEEGFRQSFKAQAGGMSEADVSNVANWSIQEPECERNPLVDGSSLSQPLSNRKPDIYIDTNMTGSGLELPNLEFTEMTTDPEQSMLSLAKPGSEIVTQTTASPTDLLAINVPRRQMLVSPATQSPPERMTTRVASGAIRHKSVSEILGETPRPSMAHVSKHSSSNGGSTNPFQEDYGSEASNFDLGIHVPLSSTSRLRLGERKEREKERSKLSTVVFAKPQSLTKGATFDLARTNDHYLENIPNAEKDYLYILFVAQASSPPRTQPLNALLTSAHKTLTTSNHYVDFHEQQDCRILKRIYQLQYSNRWSLRQIERSTEPLRPTTHWDVLLGQMRWMRTDFREERKWKITAAKNVADWCAEWVTSNAEDRILLQVRRETITRLAQVDVVQEAAEKVHEDTPQVEASDVRDSQPTPDLVPSAEDDSLSDAMDEDERHHLYFNIAPPAAIFSLAPEDVTFGLKKTPATDKILSELPLYEPTRDAPDPELPTSLISPDANWKTPCLAISKFAYGKMVSKPQEPPRKRSRYEYEEEDERTAVESTTFLEGPAVLLDGHRRSSLSHVPPEQHDVALFNPENKHIRDRIHAGHAFRPPSEHNMPSQSFFECRQSSQWTWNEDDELRKLVKEYSYNWSLISSCLSAPSLFSSGAERRTPWECFERWVGLEGLPADMSKTQYFRAYHARLEAAQRTLMAQQQASQQQQGNNPGQPPVRRRSAQPVRVERRKNNKYLALIDAMRKLAKKRESSIQKQLHAAGIAALRKANEAAQPRAPVHTPQDFSRLKYERECKMQERAEVYRQQVLAQQRAALAQRAATQQSSQQHQMPPGANPPGRLGTPGTANAASPHVGSAFPNGTFQPGMSNQSRHHPPLQALPISAQQNGPLPGPASMALKGMPPAQMQPNLPGQQRVPAPQMAPENMRVLLEANRQHEQQRFLQQRQQQQHQPNQTGPSSSPTMGSLNGVSSRNSAMLAGLQAPNGIAGPSTNGISSSAPGPSASPRLTHASQPHSTQPQPLSSGVVPAINTISNQIKARHPQLSPEQIKKMTTDSLKQYQMSQAAMSAAAGGAANNNGNLQPPIQQPMLNGVAGAVQNAQAYAQFMRQQQASQQNRGGPSGVNGLRPPSSSGTPQTQRSTSVQAGQVQSPRPPQAQMAGSG